MAFIFITGASSKSVASDVNKLVNDLVKAYGGSTLLEVSSLRIDDNYKALYTDQGVSAISTEVYKNNFTLLIDFKNKRKSLTSWEKKERGQRLTRQVFDGQQGRLEDLFHNTYRLNFGLNFENIGASLYRSHDTLLVYSLSNAKDTAQYLGESFYRGELHKKLSFEVIKDHPFILFINSKTDLITKMARVYPNRRIEYIFTNHKKVDGIYYAADLQINIDGKPQIISVSREIQLNPPVNNAFALAPEMTKSPQAIDVSKMNVRELGEGVYFVGQGYTYSLFVDSGNDLLAVGGNHGLKHRYEALIQHIGVDKPLKYQVVTHHHSDHIDSMPDAAMLGANFILVSEHVNSVQNLFEQPLPATRFKTIEKRASLLNGLVEVIDMPSSHSAHNLIVHVPKAKVLFVADHFSTDLKQGLPPADKGTVILRDTVEKLALDAQFFLGAHGPRVLKRSELEIVADSYRDFPCPEGIKACEE